jgi:lipopolysaccharide/colanic/teichoic acid biosynthesis glycosyltransferase
MNAEHYRSLKRSFDVGASSVGLIVLSPLMAIIAMTVRLKMGSPFLFRQRRVGLNECLFTLCKFRTMRDSTVGEEQFVTDAKRVTRLGRFLRSTSLDELPTLWNVLKGDMSLVGPRPLVAEYLPLYSERERKRHSVRPGITGLAQVSGRQALTFRQRFAIDVEYVESQNLLLDLQILFRTLATVVSSRGVKTGQSFSEVDDIGAQEALSAGQNLAIDAVEETP